jgi:hypothetical protein
MYFWVAAVIAIMAVGVMLARRMAPPPTERAEAELFAAAQARLEALLDWLAARAALMTTRVADAEAILVVSDGATFQARNTRIVEACAAGSRVAMSAADLACVDELLANLGGDEGEDGVIRMVALDALLLGLYVSEETYRLRATTYAAVCERLGAYLKAHGTAVTSQMRRTLGYIAEDLKDAGLQEPARALREGLRAVHQVRKAQQEIRLLKKAELTVPAANRLTTGTTGPADASTSRVPADASTSAAPADAGTAES